ANVRADQLQMNDGTVLEGTILSQGDKYWVKSADGTSKIVPASDVKKYVKGSISPAGPTATAAPAAPSAPVGDLAAVKRKADAVETPMSAVTIWQKFVESKPSGTDLATAKTEMEK